MQEYKGNSVPYQYFNSSERPCLAERVQFDLDMNNRLGVSGGTNHSRSANPTRIVEVIIAFLAGFLILTVVSFLAIRPTLDSVRMEARANWDSFVRSVAERNNLIPGVGELFRSFEPSQAKLAGRLMEARAVCLRAAEPGQIVAAVDEIEALLAQIGRLAQSKPELEQYAPLTTQWKKIQSLNQRIGVLRAQYNTSANTYNRLLTIFPQNLLAAAFGFDPLNDYPTLSGAADVRQ
jgi:hypothetical protein